MKQEGGTHYDDLGIQPVEIIDANGLDFYEGNALKYLLRYRRKGSPLQDLMKLRSYVDKLIEREDQRITDELSKSVNPSEPSAISAFKKNYKSVVKGLSDSDAFTDETKEPETIPLVDIYQSNNGEFPKIGTLEFRDMVRKIMDEPVELEEHIDSLVPTIPLVKNMIINALESYGIKKH